MEAQYVDRDVGPKDYKHLGGDLLITSMFYTLQGEGPFAGVPAVFVRFAGCNLGSKKSCSFCDTNFLFDEGIQMSVKGVYEHAAVCVPIMQLPAPIMVITGGEPMLQPGITELSRLVEEGRLFETAQIESNGLLLRELHERTTLVVSPKVNPTTQTYWPLRPDVFERANHLKFVVTADDKSPYYNVPEWAFDFMSRDGQLSTAEAVYVSPMAPYKRAVNRSEVASMWTEGLVDREQARANHKRAAHLCLTHGFTLSLQQHLYAELE